jgi:hypothetical protein
MTQLHRFSGVNDTAEIVSAVSMTPLNIIDFLGEYEAICETGLGRESGPNGGLFDKKTEGRKSRDTVPLMG